LSESAADESGVGSPQPSGPFRTTVRFAAYALSGS